MYYIGVDVGGTQLRVALIDQEKGLLLFEAFPVPKEYQEGLRIISETASKFVKDSGQNVEAVGIALPGLIGPDTLIAANNLPEWMGKPLVKDLSEKLGVPVVLIHDVAAAVLGEAIFNPTPPAFPFIYMIWGTGVGGCRVELLDGKFHLQSFEVGHQVIVPDGRQCNCGNKGCAETYMGGRSLMERYGDLSQKTDEDPLWNEVGGYAAQTILNMCAFYPAEQIIFGGGVITKRPFLLELIRTRLTTFPKFLRLPPMSISTLNDRAGVLGAAANCWVSKI